MASGAVVRSDAGDARKRRFHYKYCTSIAESVECGLSNKMRLIHHP